MCVCIYTNTYLSKENLGKIKKYSICKTHLITNQKIE